MTERKVENQTTNEGASENNALESRDAQDARIAGAKEVTSALALNLDRPTGSAGGDWKDSLKIESDGKVIACRDEPGGNQAKPLSAEDSITADELRVLTGNQNGYPWAISVLQKIETAQQMPEGAEKVQALAKAQDMADLMARRGPYALESKDSNQQTDAFESMVKSGQQALSVILELPKHAQISPEPVLIASSLDLRSDATQLAQKTTDSPAKATDNSPTITAASVMDSAERLFQQKARFADKRTGPGKCNVYVDAVMRDAHMPRPWEKVGVLSCEKLKIMMDADPRYDSVWKTDYTDVPHFLQSYKDWKNFKPHPGDVLIWAWTNQKGQPIIHMAMADGHGKMYYAGSRKTGSTAHGSLEGYTGTVEKQMNYGPPTAVYRYKNLKP